MSLLLDVACDGCEATIRVPFSAAVRLSPPWTKIVFHYPKQANVPAGVYHACGEACIITALAKFMVSGVREIGVHCDVKEQS